jgi:hypothetical protein
VLEGKWQMMQSKKVKKRLFLHARILLFNS